MTYYVDDDAYPAQTVAFIVARFGDELRFSSGVLVGRNDVLTASHVIYDPLYGLADDVQVYLSYNPSEFNTSYFGEYFEYYTSFDPDGDGRLYTGDNLSYSMGGSELDIALISLNEPIGDDLGWMGMDFGFTSGYVNVTGHPGAYSNYMTNDYGWASRYYMDDSIDITSLEINPGNSGGPVWYDSKSGPYVVGVVSTGIAAASLSGHEWLVSAVFDNDYLIESSDLVFYGTAGDDYFTNTLSGGVFYGHDGTDTVYFASFRYDNSVATNYDGTVTITNQDQYLLVDVERASFSDGTLLFGIDSDNVEFTYRIYAASYGRTPDEGGLIFWTNVMDDLATTQPLVDRQDFLANQFLLADEYIDLYGDDPTPVDYINAMYLNVLDRPADQNGYNYWLGRMQEGAGYDDILVVFAESVENKSNTAPTSWMGFGWSDLASDKVRGELVVSSDQK